MKTKAALYRDLPSVDELITNPALKDCLENISHQILVDCTREVLSEFRSTIQALDEEEAIRFQLSQDIIIKGIIKKIRDRKRMSLQPVINATGVVLHTNLGRSLLSEEVKETLWAVASEYSTLEMDVHTGKRGSRYVHVEELLCNITGAESAIVVNNNAAAVTLVLSALTRNQEVIVSRGELVEIGGSFRIPEVMAQSGAKLVEVGATNKTHLRDYENAITDDTRALLKVHTSNYRILGFTQSVSSHELVELARERNLISMEDLGSGVLIDLSSYGLSPEPTVQSAIQAGMDVVTFSGDKLLGGPQAGIITGRKKYIDIIKKHPLNRAFRIDKLTLAALEATLKIYEDGEEEAIRRIPTLRMLTEGREQLKERAMVLHNALSGVTKDATFEIEESYSQVGGGALPLEQLPTFVVSVYSERFTCNQLEEKLRGYDRPIFTRIYKDRIIFDLRTIFDGDIRIIADAIKRIFQ